ncbi:MAG: hypothetical protein AAF583_14450, partial [Pseudomonadota bacterium]
HLLNLCLLGGLIGACASSPEATERWTATASTDPITGVERCVVSIPDRRFGSSFSRTGAIYPFVEKNSELGLLVGVSSGGKIRLPTGDIEWRVDDNPHHTLRASDTPSPSIGIPGFNTSGMNQATLKAFEKSMADSAGMIFSVQNGVTAVGGDKATKLLAEMRIGKELRFRSKTAVPSAGLASASTYRTGRIENGELVPFLLDGSFERALADCGL